MGTDDVAEMAVAARVLDAFAAGIGTLVCPARADGAAADPVRTAGPTRAEVPNTAAGLAVVLDTAEATADGMVARADRTEP